VRTLLAGMWSKLLRARVSATDTVPLSCHSSGKFIGSDGQPPKCKGISAWVCVPQLLS